MLDRQLRVEILAHLALRLEELLLQAGREARLRDVHQQVRHLGLVRQLAQHGAEGLLHLRELVLVRLQVGGLARLALERAQQLGFLGARLDQLGMLRLPDEEVIAARCDQHEQRDGDAQAHGQRPAARVVRIECRAAARAVPGASSFGGHLAGCRLILGRDLAALVGEQRELRAAARVAALGLHDLRATGPRATANCRCCA